MPADVATLCDAVTSFINGETYSQSITAVRTNAATSDLEDTSDVVVQVFPGDYTVDIETRDTWRRTYSVFIVIRKVVDTLAEQDEMLLLAQEIEESLEDEDMGTYAMFSLAATLGSRSPVVPEHLLTANQFVTVLEANYVG